MNSDHNDHGFRAFWSYHWQNFTVIVDAKEKLLPRIMVISALLVWILWGARALFPSLPWGWAVKPWTKNVEELSAAVLLIFFFLWVPVRRERELKQENKKRERDNERESKNRESGLLNELASLNERLKARFSLACGMTIPGCREFSRDANLTYLRLRVENASEQQGIDGCTCNLVEVLKNGRQISFGGSRILPFAPSHSLDAGGKLLLPKVPNFIDVIAIHSNSFGGQDVQIPEVGGRPVMVRDEGMINIFDGKGEYVLKVLVSGHGVTTRDATLVFNWTGSSETSTLALV